MKSYQPYSDGQLVRMLAQGDAMAFNTLYERYRVAAIDQAYKRLRDRDVSEDIVQNIFLKIWANRARDIQHFEAFVKRSVTNGVLNYLESQTVRHKYFEPFARIKMEDVEDVDSSMQLAEKDLLALIISYTKALPEQRRKIFLLYLKDKLATDEIAERLNISQKTVQNNIRLAILELQEKIGPSAIVLLVALTKAPVH